MLDLPTPPLPEVTAMTRGGDVLRQLWLTEAFRKACFASFSGMVEVIAAASTPEKKNRTASCLLRRAHQIPALSLAMVFGLIRIIQVLEFLCLTKLSAVRFGFGHPL